MFHVNAWGTPFVAAMVGARLVLPGPHLDGDSLQLLAAEKVTVGFGVRTGDLGRLAGGDAPDRGPAAWEFNVRWSAAPRCRRRGPRRFQRDYGIALTHARGMTETSPIGTINTPLNGMTRSRHGAAKQRAGRGGRFRHRTAGGGRGWRTVARDGQSQGVSAGQRALGGRAILWSRRERLTAAGWFDTGDIGTLDANGYLVISDRARDIIKSGGEWISTVELENIAIAHPRCAARRPSPPAIARWDERPVPVRPCGRAKWRRPIC
ncbi:hypothetical protein MJ575_11640 [Klebsiella pneumoniae]|nr:hypothetical protein MJ575_11640 [Klebsiella pneumoniae]